MQRIEPDQIDFSGRDGVDCMHFNSLIPGEQAARRLGIERREKQRMLHLSHAHIFIPDVADQPSAELGLRHYYAQTAGDLG